MPSFTRLMLISLVVWCSPAIADEAAAQAASPSSNAANSGAPSPADHGQPSIPATDSSRATPASASDTQAGALIDARDRRLRNMGYKPELRHGETYYCRSEAVVGTRFPSKVCGTPAELDRATVESKDAVNQAQRQQLNPTGK